VRSLREQRALWVGRFRAWRARRAARPGPDDGTQEAEAAWFFWGLSFLFRPAGLVSAALSIESRRKAVEARRRAVRVVAGIALAAFVLAALLIALAR
jgi:hypothetical protein